jgi:2-polyprenyl-6-methoxyphenol hydroxylase-like FAD-dependent oxidoreductase
VVVGAGPCGSALALLLARQGISVQLVEARSPHQHLPRGEGLMPSGLEALGRLGLGQALEAVPRLPLRSWDFWLEQEPLFSVAEPIGGGAPCSLIGTSALLETLLQEARRSPALHWHPGRRAADLRFSPDNHRISGVELDDGSVLEADLVVACDGRDSRLRQQAELEREHDPQVVAVLWFVLEGSATAALQDWVAGRFITLVGGGESLAVYSPAGGGLRLGWLGTEPEAAGESEARGVGGEPSADWLQRWARLSPPELAALWKGLPAEAVPAPISVALQPGLAPRWHRPGLLLLGDAAHPMSPLRAQGLNMALRDGVVAAEQLAAVLEAKAWTALGSEGRQSALEAALLAIERARQPEIRRVQALQREELGRAQLLRDTPWLRRLLTITRRWSGPLLAKRWQAGQPTLRRGLPLG